MVDHRSDHAAAPCRGCSNPWLDPIADLARFRDVIAAGFADDDDERGMVRAIFARPESIEPPVLATIAQHDGADAAGGLTYRSADVAVVGWVATLPAFRGKGLGSSVTTALTNKAFAAGAGIVCLGSSPMGLSVYEHLGFERVGLDRVWFPPSTDPR
jgi:GNAT superfamily N-acetyltransferase